MRRVLQRRVAQALAAEQRRRLGALRAARVVARRGVGVARAGVERDETPVAEPQRHGLERQGAQVERERVAVAPAQHRELVEQAGLRADPVVLHARAEPREVQRVVEAHLAERDEREGERGAQCGRRREARALREVGVDAQPRARERQTLGAQLRDHAADEARASRPAPGLGGVVGREDVVLAEARAVGEHAAVEGRLGAHGDAPLDGERQAESVVVVRVLPDEVDAARAVRGDLHRRDANVPAPCPPRPPDDR